MIELNEVEAKRFWAGAIIKDKDSCWNWTMSCSGIGYGSFALKRKTTYAHRIAWVLTNGQIPDGLLLCHTCDNIKCINPNHLFLGTQKDNLQDMSAKGRANGFKQQELCSRGHNDWKYTRTKRYCKTCDNAMQRKKYRKHVHNENLFR